MIKSYSSFVKPVSKRAFTSSSTKSAAKKFNRYHFKDPYAFHHAKQRKEANMARQAVLKRLRAEASGDPVRGVPTRFVESFDSGVDQPVTADSSVEIPGKDASIQSSPLPNIKKEERLNHFISKSVLQQSIEASRVLTLPVVLPWKENVDPEKMAIETQRHEEEHVVASEAINRILSLSNANSKHRTRTNIQRIIDTFGRHVTDQYMKLKAPSALQRASSDPHRMGTPRAGPDVGSSEVQIGILTAKIRVLADRYENENRNDKVNKRNLRLLLHRRQKLLKYMLRKERGSPRWHHMIEKLGLTQANWEGQIELR